MIDNKGEERLALYLPTFPDMSEWRFRHRFAAHTRRAPERVFVDAPEPGVDAGAVHWQAALRGIKTSHALKDAAGFAAKVANQPMLSIGCS